jgi:predicted DNA-binding transcriptional regulator AlpA
MTKVAVMATTTKVPTPDQQPLLDLLDAAPLFTIGRTTAYELAKRGEFPVPILKIGKRYKVRTADLRRYLGLDSDA